MRVRFNGVLVPVVTPFTANLVIDIAKLHALCSRLLDEGATGLAVFGTTSEANSISATQRMAVVDGLIARGIPAHYLLPGVGACAVADVAELVRHASDAGCGGVLMLPPFYYKTVSDEGIFAFVSSVIERVANPTNIYLYHIPPIAQVGFGLDLIERLIEAFPGTIIGMKDSSGDQSNTKTIIARFPGFDVFCGSETFLLDTLQAGGAGCITATGSINVPGIVQVFENWRLPEGHAFQDRATLIRQTVQKFSLIPAVKAIVAQATGDNGWKRIAPPLVALDAKSEARLMDDLAAIQFKPEQAPHIMSGTKGLA